MHDFLRSSRHSAASGPGTAHGVPAPPTRILGLLAIGYPLLLVGSTLALHLVGERWWLTTIALYLPRWPLILPLPFLTVALVARGRPVLLAIQLAALLVWLFPLAGLHLGMRQTATPGRRALRVLTMNIHSLVASSDIAAEVRRSHSDLILFQEAAGQTEAWWKREFPSYEWRVGGEFVFGSRYEIAEHTTPPPSAYGASDGTRRYVRYRVVLPGTELYVYNVHAPSPSRVFEHLGRGIESGPLTSSWPGRRAELQANALHRRELLEAIGSDARASARPAIIAGDTNVPDPSFVLTDAFRGYGDAFSTVGRGFGYTFPVGRSGPWLRIDRVFVSASVRSIDSRVTGASSSDHLGLIADLEL